MDEIMKGDTNAVAIFLYLLPGFVGMATYDYLVEGPKREIFDRLVFAFSITLISSLLVGYWYHLPVAPQVDLKGNGSFFALLAGLVGSWMARTTCVSVVLSLLLACATNHGLLLGVARAARLTYKTSSVDVWQDVFYKYRRYWIRIEFKDGRVLVGWAKYYSASGEPRELFVAKATWWLKDAKGTLIPVDVKGEGIYITDFGEVRNFALLD